MELKTLGERVEFGYQVMTISQFGVTDEQAFEINRLRETKNL